jgi:hypothetical protein
MGGLSINFADVEGGFAPIPEGKYDAIIERVEVRESNSSDNDYLNFEFKLTDDEFEDRRVWTIRSFSEKALPMMKDMFVELGVMEEDDELEFEWDDDVDITPKEGPQLTSPDFDGMACVVTVKNDVYEGKERSKVTWVEAPNGGSAASSSSSRPSKSRSKSGNSSGSKKTTSRAKSGSKSGGSRRKLR